MASKWYSLKQEALELRRTGTPIRQIEVKLGIPRSTLSYWFRDIKLSNKQKEIIRRDWIESIKGSRKNAIEWHNNQKSIRIEIAKQEAREVLEKVDLTNKPVVELTMSFLYLGEGSKKSPTTSLGSSDPLILRFFLYCLKSLYQVPTSQIKCYLHLRADQDKEEIKNYWASELELPIQNFLSTNLDMRTLGKPTYQDYKGVCVISCGNVAIQRRLVWISKMFCEKITTLRA